MVMPFPYHVAQRQGARPSQEDAWCGATPAGWRLYAVFDGHGGAVTASFAAQMLPDKITTQLNARSPAEALRQSFEETSREIEPQSNDGAAALAVLTGPEQIHWAHSGDCRLLVVTTNGYQQLTREHRLENPAERTRIAAVGRAVIRPPYLFVGQEGLMMTRSLGDRIFKPVGVTATPEVGSRLFEVSDRWLVLGTDGLWDVLNNAAVTGITRWHTTARTVAEALADAAIANGGTDNVTVLVVNVG